MVNRGLNQALGHAAIALLAAAGLSLASTTVAVPEPADSPVPELNIMQDTTNQLRGLSKLNYGSVEFNSQATEEVQASKDFPKSGPVPNLYDRIVHTALTVNGKTVDITLDPIVASITYRSSPGAVVSLADKQALQESANKVGKWLGFPHKQLHNERSLLLRELAFLAEAPAGQPFPKASEPLPTQPVAPQDPNHCGALSTPSGLTPGIEYLGCNTHRHNTTHDAASHDSKTFNVRAGPDSGTDTGRCGAAGSSLQLGWTQDCLDHDFCVEHDNASISPFDGSCGDEWWRAQNDFVSTPPCACGEGLFDYDCNNAPEARRGARFDDNFPS